MAVLHLETLQHAPAQQWINLSGFWMPRPTARICVGGSVHFFSGLGGNCSNKPSHQGASLFRLFHLLGFSLHQIVFPLSQDGSLSKKHHFLTQLCRVVKMQKKGSCCRCSFPSYVSLAFNLVIKPSQRNPYPSWLPSMSHWIELGQVVWPNPVIGELGKRRFLTGLGLGFSALAEHYLHLRSFFFSF